MLYDKIIAGEVMKIKYFKLTKEERKKAKNDYYQTPVGKYVRKKLISALICSLLCIAMALYIVIDAYINDASLMEKIYGFFILFVGLILLYTYRKISVKKINDYLVKKK